MLLWDYLVTGRSAIIRHREVVTIIAKDREQANERIEQYLDAVKWDHRLLTVTATVEGEGVPE